MFYREAGQFKTTYQADESVFPIRQDRYGIAVILLLAIVGVPLIASEFFISSFFVPVLVFSFHSPSLDVGHTPYVRSQAQLARFYDWWEQVLGHLSKHNVTPATVAEVLRAAHLA